MDRGTGQHDGIDESRERDPLLRENAALARVNAEAAELLAELEEQREQMRAVNRELASANARSAELVAELQRQREEIEWTNSQLRAANEQSKGVLSVVAHDLRGGLGGIVGLMEHLIGELRADQLGPDMVVELMDTLCLVVGEGTRLSDMLEELLAAARSQQTGDQLHVRRIQVHRILDETISAQRPTASKKHQMISCRVEGGDDLAVDADPVKLRQILDNLLSNAIKYSPDGQPIEVAAWTDGAPMGRVQIAIRDRGPGFTEKDLGLVFGEFQRLSAQPTGGESSHGLGLSIVRKLVQLHGGRIEANNRDDGPGADLRFDLPCSGPDRQSRILIVDDQEIQRMLSERLLRRDGHEVVSCESGEDALSLLRDEEVVPFDLVLIDINMPGLDGIETTRCIRALPGSRGGVPIVGVSGSIDARQHEAMLAAGADVCVEKPIRGDEVVRLLAREKSVSP